MKPANDITSGTKLRGGWHPEELRGFWGEALDRLQTYLEEDAAAAPPGAAHPPLLSVVGGTDPSARGVDTWRDHRED